MFTSYISISYCDCVFILDKMKTLRPLHKFPLKSIAFPTLTFLLSAKLTLSFSVLLRINDLRLKKI